MKGERAKLKLRALLKGSVDINVNYHKRSEAALKI